MNIEIELTGKFSFKATGKR